MKRFGCLCLVCVFFVSILVFPVAAIESVDTSKDVNRYTRQQIIDMAANAFPEHRNSIISFENIAAVSTDTNAVTRNHTQDIIIVNESVSLSDSEYIVYQEHASGRAFIFIVTCGKINATSTSYATYTDYSVDLHAVCSFSSDAFLITGFRHRCTNTSFDSILSRGKLEGTVAFTHYDDYLMTETGSSEPYACYIATFNTSIYVNPNITIENVYDAYITVSISDGYLSIEGY